MTTENYRIMNHFFTKLTRAGYFFNVGVFAILAILSIAGNDKEKADEAAERAELLSISAENFEAFKLEDNEPPLITAHAVSYFAFCSIDEYPPFTTFQEWVDAGGQASDNCGVDEESFRLLSEVSDGETCPETVTRTYEIADLCGNVTTCQQIIIINDLEDPVLNCPADLAAVCDIAEFPPYETYADFTDAGGTATDNCAIDEASFTLLSEESTGSCPEIITRTYQVADLCGNTTTCVQTITVNDDELPSMNCPDDLVAVCDISELAPYADYAAFVDAGGSADDNCGINEASFTLLSETSDNASCPETVTRVYQVADLCGNLITCTQRITIDDEILPTMTCPENLTAVCDISEQPPYADYAAFVDAGGSADDNCGINEASFTLLSETTDSESCPEVVTRVYEIEDLCGNKVTCTQTITINDDVLPTMTCPEPLTAVCNIGEQPVYADYAAFVAAGGSADDNCGIDEASFTLLSETSDNETCPETVTRVYEIADLCGNKITCQQTITINDEEAPEITCPGPLTASCDISELPPYADYAAFAAAGGDATDNCGIDEASFRLADEVEDGNACPKVYTRTYEIADLCGNIITCTQTITINDDEDPTMTCPDPLEAVCDISELPPYADYTAFVAAGGSADDNCGINEASFTLLSEESNGETCPQIITRTYQVEDLCGNTVTCTQTITINDDVLPTMTCPDDLTAVCDISEQPAYADYAAFVAAGGSANDNCGIDEASFILLSENSDGETCPETVTRVYQVADLCGNLITCTQTITINDDVLPTMTCPEPLTATCTLDELPAYQNYTEFTDAGGSADDNCGINEASFRLANEVSEGTCPQIVTRTYEIADLCGNIIQCTHVLTINDTEPPVLVCPPVPENVTGGTSDNDQNN